MERRGKYLWLKYSHISFYKDDTESQKVSPCPKKAEAKALKTKTAALKGIHSHKKKIHSSYTFQTAKKLAEKAAQVSSEEHPQEKEAWPLWNHQGPSDLWVSHKEGRR